MQAPAGLADPFDQLRLDGHVDVFLGDIGVELVGFDVGEDGEQAALDLGEVLFGEKADAVKHRGVGDGAEDVVLGEAEVEGEGFDKLHGEGVLGGRPMRACQDFCGASAAAMVAMGLGMADRPVWN